MSEQKIVGGLGQGGVRAMRAEVNNDLAAAAPQRGGVEPPDRGGNALVGFVQRWLDRSIPAEQRREFMESTRHLQSERPDIASEICDVIRDGISAHEIPDIAVCLGDDYDFSADGDGYRLSLPKHDPKAYCHDDDTPDC